MFKMKLDGVVSDVEICHFLTVMAITPRGTSSAGIQPIFNDDGTFKSWVGTYAFTSNLKAEFNESPSDFLEISTAEQRDDVVWDAMAEIDEGLALLKLFRKHKNGLGERAENALKDLEASVKDLCN